MAKDLVQHKGIELKWNPADQGWLEGIFSRGDRRLAEVVMAAHRLGCRFDAWTEHFRLDRWRQAFAECNIDPESYLRARSLTETLPWDHIDSGVRKDFLETERGYALQGIQTPDCRRQSCQDCGVCDMVDIQPVTFSPSTPWTEQFIPPPDLLLPGEEGKVKEEIRSRGDNPLSLNSNGASYYRLQFAKLDRARWFSHLELVSILHRAIRRTGLPISFSQGFHPLPRLSFHNALPVGMESLGETMDVEMDTQVSPVNLVSGLNESLPSGLKILGADYMPKRLPPPKYCGHLYAVQSQEAPFTSEVLEEFRGRPECLVSRKKPKEVRHIDLCPLLEEVRLLDEHNLELRLKQREKDNLKASEAVAAIFSLDEAQTRQLKIIKIKSYTQ
jgi:radical SAM-linked protein